MRITTHMSLNKNELIVIYRRTNFYMRCILNSFAKIAELSAWHEYQKHTSRASSCRHAIFWL